MVINRKLRTGIVKMRNIIITSIVIFFCIALSIPYIFANNLTALSGKDESNMHITSDLKTTHIDSIVMGLGCFWGPEKRFSQIPGVIDVVSGYADGEGIEPDYREIIKATNKYNPDNFAEVIKVDFNSNQISLRELLQAFFEQHDPTQGYRQGNDIGTQYRSTILYSNTDQMKLAEQIKAEYQALLEKNGFGEITTIIKPLDKFYTAEEYHQDYLVKNPNGYCPDHSTGVRFDGKQETIEKQNNVELVMGKQIVVIESEHCPYCEKFKQDVANDYSGTIPMHFRTAEQLHGLTVTSPTWATPTILFLEDGIEQMAIQGYVNAKDFYKALGYFKLGDSEAFRVAFDEGTDSRFCKQYEEFKNTPDGVFVDKLSGIPLFDTNDRFNSGSGWLSFTKPASKDAVYYIDDNSYGMNRVEVRTKVSDIHLGHVFDDGPNGQPRYCINATVLEFVAR